MHSIRPGANLTLFLNNVCGVALHRGLFLYMWLKWREFWSGLKDCRIFFDNFLIEYLIFAYSVVLLALSAYDLHCAMTSTSSQVWNIQIWLSTSELGASIFCRSKKFNFSLRGGRGSLPLLLDFKYVNALLTKEKNWDWWSSCICLNFSLVCHHRWFGYWLKGQDHKYRQLNTVTLTQLLAFLLWAQKYIPLSCQVVAHSCWMVSVEEIWAPD